MTRVPVTIKFTSLLWPRWVAAMVPTKRTILVRTGVTLTQRLLAHELAHVAQAEKHPWPLAYVGQWAATGFRYHDMPFEVEARKAEQEPWYRAWASDIMAARAA